MDIHRTETLRDDITLVFFDKNLEKKYSEVFKDFVKNSEIIKK